MTTVRWSDWFGFWLGGGGCGTSASSPLGVKGVITMKMMISTSKTSIIGVMLISDFGPPDPPTAIPIKMLLKIVERYYLAAGVAPVVAAWFAAFLSWICSVSRPRLSTPAARRL